ncbi:MAG: hypothetical protein LBG58_13405 [Planctomycetaceae bacterium]|jgi:hypothetical protein|nr:hypothetical protein [Planctomycetaceae bacterium]
MIEKEFPNLNKNKIRTLREDIFQYLQDNDYDFSRNSEEFLGELNANGDWRCFELFDENPLEDEEDDD